MMHDEPPFSWRTEFGLLLSCAAVSVTFIGGCWLSYHIGTLVGDVLRLATELLR